MFHKLLRMAAIGVTACVAVGPRGTHAASAPLVADDSTNTIRVVCIGDDITAGIGLAQPQRDGYPARLERLLGPRWVVVSMAVPGVTCLATGDVPLYQQNAIPMALSSDPDVVVIMLGTNDAKTNNWTQAERFVGDYTDLVKSFTEKWSPPQVWICTPPPVHASPEGPLSDTILRDELVPRIEAVAEQTGISVIDIRHLLNDKPDRFPDAVHPDAEGHLLIAEQIYRAITGRVPP
ncbi:MAG: GDSL-type esterase/lipase family protein, partial [Verrucomicrobia bacterium]|nr:GDSL-type esterase/lipase family protein [Verrucomicrobiota bacterium]